MGFSFSNVKATPVEKAKAKNKKAQHAIDSLLSLAAINNAIKSLTTLKVSLEGSVKNQMSSLFVAKGASSGLKPDSFEGTDGVASASCELRKRSAVSKLSPEEVAILTDHKIPFETSSNTTETFIFNPAYLSDAKLMAKVEKALSTIVGLPDDFIQHQTGATFYTVSDETVDAVFKLKDASKIATLMPIVTTLAIKPKLNDDEVVADTVRELLLGEAKKVEEAEVAVVEPKAETKTTRTRAKKVTA